jgi:hypothetical protein
MDWRRIISCWGWRTLLGMADEQIRRKVETPRAVALGTLKLVNPTLQRLGMLA